MNIEEFRVARADKIHKRDSAREAIRKRQELMGTLRAIIAMIAVVAVAYAICYLSPVFAIILFSISGVIGWSFVAMALYSMRNK